MREMKRSVGQSDLCIETGSCPHERNTYHQGVCLGEKRRISARDWESKLLLDVQLLTWLQTLAKSDHTDKEERNDENWRFIQGAARASTHEHDGLCGARRGAWHRHAGEPTRRGPR